MSVFKAILKILGGLFIFVVLAVVAFEIYKSIDKIDTFYLKDAEFTNFNYLSDLDKKIESKDENVEPREEMNVYVHRLSKGSGLILAYRSYTNGDVWAIDDEGFTKITIWLAKTPESFPTKYDLSSAQSIKAAFTAGGSAWPRAACSGYIESGNVSIRELGSSYVVRVTGTVYPAGSSLFGGYCKVREIDYEFTASQIQYTDLTPWLGLKGDHPYNETYR